MQANPIKITSTNSLSFNSAEMFTASHVSDGINLMLLLFLLCLLISFNLTRESEKKVVRVRFSPLYIPSQHTNDSTRVYHCAMYADLMLEYVSTEDFNPITSVFSGGSLLGISFYRSSFSSRRFFALTFTSY